MPTGGDSLLNNQSISLQSVNGPISAGGRRTTKLTALICAALAFVMIVCGCPVSAQSRSLRQFEHTVFSLQSGAPSQIQSLVQTKDGFIWMGTVNGLFRFDGVTFEAYRPPHGQQFPHNSIQCLSATADGGLWIGYTLGDTSFLKDGVLTTQTFRPHVHLGGGTVYAIVTRRDGSTWAATNDGALRFVSGLWQDAETDVATRVKTSTSLFEDNSGTLWMSTEDFVYRLPPGARHFEKTSIAGGDTAIFTQARDGSLWIAEPHGVYPVADSHGGLSASHGLISYGDSANDFGFDVQGSLWIAGSHTGVTLLKHPEEALRLPPEAQQQSMEHMTSNNGLTSEMALSLLQDRDCPS